MAGYDNNNLDDDTDDNDLDSQEETPDEQPTSLSAAITPAKQKPDRTVALPAENAPSYEWLQKQHELAEKFANTASPQSESNLKDALAKADAAYKEKTNRNDWAEVAQNLSNAIVQFGASQYGAGHEGQYGDAPVLNLGKGIDYKARNERARNEYLTEQKNAQLLDDLARKRDAATSLEEKNEYTEKMKPLQAGATLASKAESEGRITSRDIKLQGMRDSEKADLDKAKNSYKQTGMQSRSIGDQIKQERAALAKETDQTNKVIGQLPNLLEADDTGREADKLKAQYGKSLPGEDWAGLKDRLSKATKPGAWWGTNPDPEARKKIIDDEVENLRGKLRTHQDMIDKLQERRDSLLQMGEEGTPSPEPTSAGTAAASAPPTPESQSEVVTIQGPSGSVAKMNKDKAQKYLSQPGYKLVK